MVVLHTIDEERIAAAVRAAEAGTRAELVCVMARTSSTYEFFPLVWAALGAFAAPWILIEATLWSVETIFATQLAVFLVLLAVLSLPSIRLRLVPRRLKRRRAHRAATEQFVLRGLSRTAEATGVLIFVSQAERYARIIADDGVASRVEATEWSAAIRILTDHARDGRMTDGFVAAIERCGAILAQHLPPCADDVNELSDRFFVI